MARRDWKVEHAKNCPANRKTDNAHSPCRRGNCPVFIAKTIRGLMEVAGVSEDFLDQNQAERCVRAGETVIAALLTRRKP